MQNLAIWRNFNVNNLHRGSNICALLFPRYMERCLDLICKCLYNTEILAFSQ